MIFFQYWYLILNNWQSFSDSALKRKSAFLWVPFASCRKNRRSLAAGSKDKRKLVFSYGLTDGIDRLLFKDIWAYELFSD
ncbi:hypothetical protein EA72_00950 [Enterococcus faecium]|nr:hypothetical protein EA95_01529 [Enterococcus faecium]RBT28933.1 hypothetical protein EA72_00950 [Enterococcus faecium]RBT31421.1 hypothetical protein EB01_01349 [Enterococcus faecium]